MPGRRGKPVSRVLYFFRTPPSVKVGRQPFTDDVRRALERQYPDITFEWEKLLDIAIPPPDAERWRERRRAERAARQELEAEAGDAESGEPEIGEVTEPLTPSELELVGAVVDDAAETSPLADEVRADTDSQPASSVPVGRKRRRRRGSRHRRQLDNRAPEAVERPAAAPSDPDLADESE